MQCESEFSDVTGGVAEMVSTDDVANFFTHGEKKCPKPQLTAPLMLISRLDCGSSTDRWFVVL